MNPITLSIDDWLNSDIEIIGSGSKFIEVASTKNGFNGHATINILDIQRLITKLYLQYNDSEAVTFLGNLNNV